MNGFCNDITIDAAGNVYATDSWYPRVLRLANGGAGGATLTNWLVNTTVFPVGQWQLNGIDADPSGNYLYVVNQAPVKDAVTGTDTYTVTVVDTSTNQPVKDIEVGQQPYDITSSGDRVYVVNVDQTVTVIDSTTNDVVDTFTLDRRPQFSPFNSAASVVLLPEPVGPVTKTRPARRSASFWMAGGQPRSASVGILRGMMRKTAPTPAILCM